MPEAEEEEELALPHVQRSIASGSFTGVGESGCETRSNHF